MNTRRLAWVFAAVACTPAGSSDDADTDDSDAPGPTRVVYGRVHDAADANVGLFDAKLMLGGAEARSDVIGTYRIEAATSAVVLRVDASADGWTPHAVHLSAWPGAVEVWPGLLPIDETDRALGIMAASSGIATTLQPDLAYVVAQVRDISDLSSLQAGAQVSVSIDGEPAPFVYGFLRNEALDVCLPSLAPSGTATTDRACTGLVLVPEVRPGADVRIVVEHTERVCARSAEERIAGQGRSSLEIQLRPVAGALNITGVECERP